MRGLLIGLLLVLTGFGYDVFFAGLPYQDPPPELQAQWLRDKAIAAWIMRAGVCMSLVSLAALALRRPGRRSGPPPRR